MLISNDSLFHPRLCEAFHFIVFLKLFDIMPCVPMAMDLHLDILCNCLHLFAAKSVHTGCCPERCIWPYS